MLGNLPNVIGRTKRFEPGHALNTVLCYIRREGRKDGTNERYKVSGFVMYRCISVICIAMKSS